MRKKIIELGRKLGTQNLGYQKPKYNFLLCILKQASPRDHNRVT
jgi:hypothetical protein